jgi:hypothetical protein
MPAKHLAPPLAATKPARRTAPDLCRWTVFGTPTVWYFATSAIKQASFSTRRNREGQGPRRSPVWRFVRCSIELRAKRHTGLLRGAPWLSRFLRVEKLACLPLGSAPRTRERRVSTGRCKEVCISRGTWAGSGLGGSGPESVCYRHLSRNSSRAAAIRTVSSADGSVWFTVWFSQAVNRAFDLHA